MNAAHKERLARLSRLDRGNLLGSTIPCKVCGLPAAFFDVVDFNKTTGGYAFGPAGISVPWHRCEDCGFLFTPFFDDWSSGDFARFVYNDDYILVDPDYVSNRPKAMAEQMARLLSGHEKARILDYGSGANIFASRLAEMGFTRVESFDPFSSPERPVGQFDIITCIEVIEHSPAPVATLADMRSFLLPEGCVLIGETLQPSNIDSIRCSWWYAAPRNGHVSTFADRTFAALAKRSGMTFHRGEGQPHVFLSGSRFSELANRCGPPIVSARLGAPGSSPAKGFSGAEGISGQQFKWTSETAVSWKIDVPAPNARVQIFIPFVHESRSVPASKCALHVNGMAVATTVRERSVFAETPPLPAGTAEVTLRTPELTQMPHRAVGLAIRASAGSFPECDQLSPNVRGALQKPRQNG